MDEYISREKALDKLIEGDGNDEFTEGYNFAVNEYREKIKAMPSADVYPVKHGRWEYYEKEYGECAWYFCSLCDEPAEQLYNDEPLLSEFCPHCGARMDGDEK